MSENLTNINTSYTSTVLNNSSVNISNNFLEEIVKKSDYDNDKNIIKTEIKNIDGILTGAVSSIRNEITSIRNGVTFLEEQVNIVKSSNLKYNELIVNLGKLKRDQSNQDLLQSIFISIKDFKSDFSILAEDAVINFFVENLDYFNQVKDQVFTSNPRLYNLIIANAIKSDIQHVNLIDGNFVKLTKANSLYLNLVTDVLENKSHELCIKQHSAAIQSILSVYPAFYKGKFFAFLDDEAQIRLDFSNEHIRSEIIKEFNKGNFKVILSALYKYDIYTCITQVIIPEILKSEGKDKSFILGDILEDLLEHDYKTSEIPFTLFTEVIDTLIKETDSVDLEKYLNKPFNPFDFEKVADYFNHCTYFYKYLIQINEKYNGVFDILFKKLLETRTLNYYLISYTLSECPELRRSVSLKKRILTKLYHLFNI